MKNNRKEILDKLKEVLDNSDVTGDYRLKSIKSDVEGLLLSLYLEDATGIRVDGTIFGHHVDHTGMRDSAFVYLGGESSCSISWEDDDLTPREGWYFKMFYHTGAYLFDAAYPKKTFNEFFQTIKSFGADYCDTVNSSLYFNVETNKETIKSLVKEYDNIFKKYWDLGKEEVLQEKIKVAEEQLKALRGEKE